MSVSIDRRVRKTKKAMAGALAHLLSEKPLKSITVREISELADINRGTFYLHYKDVYDMVEQIQNDIYDKFNEIVDNYVPKENAEELFPMLVEFFNLLSENADLAKCMIDKNGDVVFVNKLKNTIKEKCFYNIRKTLNINNDDEFDYFYQYIVSGCIGICSAWLTNNMKETPAQMAALVEKLILKGAEIF